MKIIVTLKDGTMLNWEKGRKASPTLMLYDFDDDANWSIEQTDWPVGLD